MLSRATAGQDVQHVFAFKNAVLKIALKIAEDAVAWLELVIAVEHHCLRIQDRCFKVLCFHFLLLKFREHDIQQQPLPNDAEWLFCEGYGGQFDQLIVFKP
ncbi:hypothetical protein AF70_00001300 [Pseudomonas sp. KD5]|nr:hypothetical protein [Pseudomonas sp. KD5]